MGLFAPSWVYNIGTTVLVLNGGISMVIFFFVNKIIFPNDEEREAREKETETIEVSV